jgi:hypothetical protein
VTRAAIPLVLLFALACEEPFRFATPAAVVRLLPDSATIDEGRTLRLQVVVQDSAGQPVDRTVTWTSSEPLVASVSNDGTVTGRAGGTAEITATADGASDVTRVRVRAAVASISITSAQELGGRRRRAACRRDARAPASPTGGHLDHRRLGRRTNHAHSAGRPGHGTRPRCHDAHGDRRYMRRVGDHTVSAVASRALGASRTTCAPTANGQAWCWGDDQVGQLGNGLAGASAAEPRPRRACLRPSARGRFTCGATPLAEPYCETAQRWPGPARSMTASAHP